VTLECPSTLCKSLPTNDKKTKAFRRRRCLRIKNCNGSSPATIINKTNAFAAFLLDFLCGAVWGHRIDEVFPQRCCHLEQSKQETNPKIIFFFGDRFHRSVFDDSPGAQILKLFLHVWAVSMTNGHREMVKTILDSVLESPPKHQIA
jgi:hypothetical protein